MYVPRAREFMRPTCPYLSVFVRCVRCARIVRPSVARVCVRAPVRNKKTQPKEREKRENPRAEARADTEAPAPNRRHKLSNTNTDTNQKPQALEAQPLELDPSKLLSRSYGKDP